MLTDEKGDPVTESRPFFKNFSVTSRVNHGKPRRLYLIIYSDETSQVAPLSKTEAVRELCTVEADLGQIPESQMPKRQGIDGFMYFSLDGQIEIVCKYLHLWHHFTIVQNASSNTDTRQIADYHVYPHLQRYVHWKLYAECDH